MSRPTSLAIALPETTIAWAPCVTCARPANAQSAATPAMGVGLPDGTGRPHPAASSGQARNRNLRRTRTSVVRRDGPAGGCPRRRTGSNLAVPDNYLDPRLTERRNPRTATVDTASALEIVDLIGAEDAGVPASVATARVEIAQAIDLIEAAFRAGGRLLYVGAGTSGRLGVLDAAECPPTFGTAPEMVVGVIAGGAPALVRSVEGAEDDMDAAASEMERLRVTQSDVVVGIAASGTTPFVQAALSRAHQLRARTVFLSCTEPPRQLQGV